MFALSLFCPRSGYAEDVVYQHIYDSSPIVQVAPVPGEGVWVLDDQGKISYFNGKTYLPLSDITRPPRKRFHRLIYDDAKQALWLLADDQLYRYTLKNDGWDGYFKGKIDTESVIAQSSKGLLVTMGKTLWRFDSSSRLFVFQKSTTSDITGIFLADDRIHIATAKQLLLFQHGEYSEIWNFSDKTVSGVLHLANLHLIGTDNGLFIVHDDGQAEQIPLNGSSKIIDLTKNTEAIWVATPDGVHGLRREGKKLSTIQNKKLFVTTDKPARANDLAISGDTLWIGSTTGIGYRPIEASSIIRRITTDKKGNLTGITPTESGYLVSTAHTIELYDLTGKKRWQRDIVDRVHSQTVLEDFAWLATSEGIRRISLTDGKVDDVLTIDDVELSSAERIFSDGRSLWIWSLSSGLSRYWPENQSYQSLDFGWDGGRNARVTNVIPGEDETIWLTTTAGIYSYRNGQFTLQKESEYERPANALISHQDVLWFIDAGQLFQWAQNSETEAFRIDNPRLFNAQCILSVGSRVVVVTQHHLAWAKNTRSGKLEWNTSQLAGTFWPDSNTLFCGEKNGNLVLASANKLVIFSSRYFDEIDVLKYSAFVSQISAEGRKWRIGVDADGIYNVPKGQDIEIELSKLNDSNHVTDYRLSGDEPGLWRRIGSGEPLKIYRLPAGNYQLSVREGGTERRVMAFSVTSPWYHSKLTISFVLFLCLAFVSVLITKNIHLRRVNRGLKYLAKTERVNACPLIDESQGHNAEKVFSSSDNTPVQSIETPSSCEKEPLENPELNWVREVKQVIDNHYHDPSFSTFYLATLLSTSERTLQRKFRAHFQMSVKEYINVTRLEKARKMLLNNVRVTDVALKCGFNEASYFSQRFKQQFGLSPTVYIEEMRKLAK
ncbi:AraC family transcriptional regulator [Veronia pacifica]|uniref:HTH araC/xylS-type domain-containing protein n=1 Tax=Veronia pacifica TaxID=1080227 RepID=A0A1C3ERG6_9GAMM|nr:AraC family transcriptional regulator [Veronia pacifica]ODA35839.1 hypothetical protein A8L45_02035 [Veronia pacifica]